MKTSCLRWMVPGLLVAIFFGGCSQSGNPDPASGPEAVEVVTGDDAGIPEGFPADVPLPENLRVDNVSALPAQGTYVLQGHVPDELESVAPVMHQRIMEQGWTEDTPAQAQELPDMKMVNFKKEGKMLNVTLFREDNGTSVNLTTSPN